MGKSSCPTVEYGNGINSRSRGIAIAPGAERFLIELENKPSEQTAALRQILGKLEMEIIYTDIYDKPQKHLISDFQYFDRAEIYF